MRLRHRTFLIAAAAAIVVSPGCSDSSGPQGASVASVDVSPTTASVSVGASTPLQATVRDAQGNPLSDRQVFWASSDNAIATVSELGVVTGVAPGSVQIAASSEGKYALANVTVLANTAASVSVSPLTTSIQVRTTARLTATALDAQGQPLTGKKFTWSSNAPSVATVDATGLVTGISPGPAVITASVDGKSAVAAVTVTAIPVASVSVGPSPVTVTVGGSARLTATTRDAQNDVLTGRVITWSSSAPDIAQVSSTGVVVGIAQGSATITATSEGKSGTAAVTVQPVPASSVVVSPAATSITVGAQTTLQAQVTDANGNALPGRPVTWSSSASSVATVNGSGVVTGVSAGTATITATSEGKSGTAVVTVTNVPVASVSVSPPTATLVIGQTLSLTATPRDASGNALSGRAISWRSSNTDVATVDGNGNVTAVAAGSAVIFASSEGKAGSATITVQPVPIASVDVTPPSASLQAGETVQLTATVTDANGHTVSNATVDWQTSDSHVAIVSSSGMVVALNGGSATITATAGGKTGSSSITVTTPPPTVASVTVSAPRTSTLMVGDTTQLVATARDGNGNPISGATFTWSTDNAAVATVDASGLVTAVSPGTANISASSGGQTGSVAITVQAPAGGSRVGSVQVSPNTLNLRVGATGRLTAAVRDPQGHALSGVAVAWTTDNGTVAAVDSSGTVSGIARGNATVTAAAQGKSDQARVNVR